MLHVEGAVDIDAGRQQLFYVLVALLMAAAGGVAVGQLVHYRQLRAAGQQAVEIHFVKGLATVGQGPARRYRQARQQLLGVLAAMGFHYPYHHIQPLGDKRRQSLEHGVGLTHARGRA